MYKNARDEAGHQPENLKIGIHSLGYISDTSQKAADQFLPGYAEMVTEIGKERCWVPVTRV